MSDGTGLERALGGELEATDAMSTFTTGVPFNAETAGRIEARQAEIDGILAHEYKDPADRVRDLNLMIASADDDVGISYAHIAAVELPGLEIHGVAEKLAFSAVHAPNANFESGRLNASVFTASNLQSLRARGANMDDIVAPLSSFAGAELPDVSMLNSVLNFADIKDARLRGSILASSYLVGTLGLAEVFNEAGDITAARVLLHGAGVTHPSEILRNALADRFMDVEAGDMLSSLDPVRILRGSRVANALPDVKRLDGVVLDDLVLTNTQLPGRNMTGSVWHNIHGRGVSLRGTKAAGTVVINSDLQDGDASHFWGPGMFAINSNLRGMPMPRSNMGGAVFYNVDLEGADTEGGNFDGVVIVGGKAPEFEQETRNRLKIVGLGDLPAAVAANIVRLGALSVSGPSTHELEN